MKILLEVYSASEPPDDEEPKQVFSMSGDFWITAHYKAGDWIDDAGHAVVNVVVWCELPHPANFMEMIPKTLYEEIERESSI